MFNKEWFIKYQKLLLWLCNTPLVRIWFRWVMRIDDRGRIDTILPNATFRKLKGGKIHFDIRTHAKYSKRLYFGFYYLWVLIHTWDTIFANRYNPRLNLGFDAFPSEPLFPAAGANSPVDGRARRHSVDEIFGTIRAGAGTEGASSYSTGASSIALFATTTTNQYSELIRSIYCFDTSGLGGGTVDTAIFSLNGESKGTALGAFEADVVASTPASNSDIVAADYGQLGATVFASVASASLTANNTYTDFTLDANGEANIDTSGISKFGLKINWDTDNSAPWVSGAASSWESSWADTAGTTQDPKLTGTYTPAPVTIRGYKSLLGVGQA